MRSSLISVLAITSSIAAAILLGDRTTHTIIAVAMLVAVVPIWHCLTKQRYEEGKRDGMTEICPDEASRDAVALLAARIRKNRTTPENPGDPERPAQFPHD